MVCIVAVSVWMTLSIVLYRQFFKRFYDIFFSGIAIIVFSPLFLVLTIVGAIVMKGNPYFTQERPGKDEKIFKLIKFRTMTNEKDEMGKPLPDDRRLTRYGRTLRSTSLDELPELFNILKGDMSIVGPRPLLVEYLPYYTKEERKRHHVRSGLTGLAQVNGRNTLTWEEKFKYDIEYVDSISFLNDVKIILKTVKKVFKREDILVGKQFKVGKLIDERRDWVKTPEGAVNPQETTSIRA